MVAGLTRMRMFGLRNNSRLRNGFIVRSENRPLFFSFWRWSTSGSNVSGSHNATGMSANRPMTNKAHWACRHDP